MKDIIGGAHAWLARDGVTIGGDVVNEETLPDFTTTEAEWLKLPSVEGFEVKFNKNTVKRRAPVTGGGRYGVRKTIQLGTELTYAFDLQEWDALTMEMLFGADAIGVGGAFKPGLQLDPIAGFLHVKLYDQSDTLIIAGAVRVELSVDAFKFGENLNPHALMAEVIVGNALNTHALTNLT